VLNLRLWNFGDAGSSWTIRCKQCAAGWLPAKGDYHPGACIEHSLMHQRRPGRIDELRVHLKAVDAAIAAIERDVVTPATTLERRHFLIWQRMLGRELEQLTREQVDAEARAAAAPPRLAHLLDGGDRWLPNRSYITHGAWRP
jgi:hypothetical protein